MKHLSIKKHLAFTLAEVLITLGIIGVVAEMTIPTLLQSTQERQMVSGLQEFNSTLQQAVMMWKQDIDCTESARNCISSQGLPDDVFTNFDQVAKFLKFTKKVDTFGTWSSTSDWLPDNITDYYGTTATGVFGNVSKFGSSSGAYLLANGMTFSVDSDVDAFDILADVNGKKLPNRIGKDIFFFTIGGGTTGKDIYYAPRWAGSNNANGLCTVQVYDGGCDPTNVNPTTGTAASPTAYVILKSKWPDFTALSKTVGGFKP